VRDRDVVTAKLSIIERCLSRIAEVRGPRRGTLLPLDVEDITSLNLQRAVQAAMDLASHVVAAEGYGTPDSTAGAFALLEEHRVLDPELSRRLKKMVGFRNIAIHEYQTVDPAVLASILDRHLGDLLAFGHRVVDAFGLQPPAPESA